MTMHQPHTAQAGASTYQDLLANLKQTMAELQSLREQAIETLTPTVQELVHSASRDVQRIEHTLDQLLNVASLPKSALNDGEFATIKNHSAVDRDVSVLSTHPTPF